MDANWKLLADLVQYNRTHGDKTDEEVVRMFLSTYAVSHESKDAGGEIEIEYALRQVDLLINATEA